MSESISVDFFGNLNTHYELWSEFLQEIRKDHVKVHIISGPWEDELFKRLEQNKYYRDVHYDYTHSILSHLRSRGMDTFYDEGYDSWYSQEGPWWESKAIICQQQKIKIHFDSERKFEPAFKLIPTRFIYVNYFVRQHIKSLTKMMELDTGDGIEEQDFM